MLVAVLLLPDWTGWAAGGCSAWKPFTSVSSSDCLRLHLTDSSLGSQGTVSLPLLERKKAKWPAVLERTSQKSLGLTLGWGRSKTALSAYFLGVLMTLAVRWCKRAQDLAFSALAAACGWGVFRCGLWWWYGWGCCRCQQIRLVLASSSTGNTGSKISACWVGKDKASREGDAIFKFPKILNP